MTRSSLQRGASFAVVVTMLSCLTVLAGEVRVRTFTDVGNTTNTTLDGLDDCVTWHFAVTAYNAAGESGFSGDVASLPRSVLSGIAPANAVQGTQASLVVSGVNFEPGDVVAFSNPGIQLDDVNVTSCQEMVLTVTVASDAPPGAADITVTHASGVSGTGEALLTIVPPVPPTVLSTTPADGSLDVSIDVSPVVQFSEAVTGVTSATVRLVDIDFNPVTQAAGSPVLSQDGTVATLVPAGSLNYATTYRIQVLGGDSGVQDMDGNPMADDFLQANGFTTEDDDAAPVIEDVAVTSITGTTAVVTWTTNEAADSRVFFRKNGGELYQLAERSDLVTEHSVSLTGLEPDTTYEFHVSSTDAAGKTGNMSTDETFTTTESSFVYLRFEAEAGVLADPLDVGSGSAAFAGTWIETPAGSQSGTPGNPLGSATLGVQVPSTGTWHLWVRVHGADVDSDAWYESIDGAGREALSAEVHGEWTWVAGRSYSLTQGQHVVELGGRDPGARADRLLLTDDPDFLPTEQPDADVTPPGPVTGLLAAGSAGQVQLTWSNPSASDLERVVVRVRDDGAFPTSPVDGIPLADMPATPGSPGSHVHTGVVEGVTYHYGVFAIDASGNVAQAAEAVGVPMIKPLTPSGLVVH
jgi:hypothetical protein